MSMTEYEISLVNESKKGKKKSLDRLFDSVHKDLIEVIKDELCDTPHTEEILKAVFDKMKSEIANLEKPEDFEDFIKQLTVKECGNYEKVEVATETQEQETTVLEEAQPAQQEDEISQPQEEVEAEKIELEEVSQEAEVEIEEEPEVAKVEVKNCSYYNVFPTVGWLVCTQGCDKGRDFVLKAKINTIGADESNDIILRNDENILAENHVSVVYDRSSNEFMLLNKSGASNVLLNETTVGAHCKLSTRDIITISQTKLVFVALCDDKFTWDK